jgi:hypothetical protein
MSPLLLLRVVGSAVSPRPSSLVLLLLLLLLGLLLLTDTFGALIAPESGVELFTVSTNLRSESPCSCHL